MSLSFREDFPDSSKTGRGFLCALPCLVLTWANTVTLIVLWQQWASLYPLDHEVLQGRGSCYHHCILTTRHEARYKRDLISSAVKLVLKCRFGPTNWCIRELSRMWIFCLLVCDFICKKLDEHEKLHPTEPNCIGKYNEHTCTYTNIHQLPQFTTCVMSHTHPHMVLQHPT